jgi:DNA-binding Lrp family transcriptional regulator
VEIDTAPGMSREVAAVLAADPEAATVKLTSGARDILALAQAPDLRAVSGYLLDRVGHIPGVTNVRSHLATRSALQASRWRVGALNPEQRRRLRPDTGPRPEHAVTLQAADRRIARALNLDGRMSYERLAQHVGIGPVAVRRRLTRLEEGGLITFRCDTSRHLSGREVAAVYFGSLDTYDLDDAKERIQTFPEVRSCSIVAGPHNVIIDALLRSTADVHALERSLSQALPALRIQDRSVVLLTIKLLGRILDADGRSVRSVPLLSDSQADRRPPPRTTGRPGH